MAVTATYTLSWATEGGLNPSTWSDETSRLVSANITRGRDNVTDQIQPGTMSLVLLNTDGRYSPTGMPDGWQLGVTGRSELGTTTTLGAFVSTFYPNAVPGRAVKLVATYDSTDYPLFFGYVQDIQVAATPGGPQFCTVRVVDLLSVLSREQTSLTIVTNWPVDNPPTIAEKIAFALGDSPNDTYESGDGYWANGRELPTALRDIDATVYEYDCAYSTQSVLAIIQSLASYEAGIVFATPAGKLAFRSNDSRSTRTESTTSAGLINSAMGEIRADMLLSDIYTAVKITYNGGTETATAEDADAIDAYGMRRYELALPDLTDDYGLNADALAAAMATYLLEYLQAATIRPVVSVINSTEALLLLMLDCDIGYRLSLLEPTYTGINGDYFVESVTHDITDGGTVHRTTWRLSQTNRNTYNFV